MDDYIIYRMRSSVALTFSDGVLEAFFTNTRDRLLIEIEYERIIDFLLSFDGEVTAREVIYRFNDVDYDEARSLISYMNAKNVLIEVDCSYYPVFYNKNHRLINMLEDYACKASEVLRAYNDLSSKRVMIVGLGAVGTWVLESLVRSGVKNFILVDDDVIEASNLHRQTIYDEKSLGASKIEVASNYLRHISDVDVVCIKDKLYHDFFDKYKTKFDLVVNCADYPSVDETTFIISRECMERGVPHIIGGGYNLHLTLVGQTVIPFVTACAECFRSHLEKINNADLDGVRKLERSSRKIGSFGPLSALAGALAALDAFKILIGSYNRLANINARMEFKISDRSINLHQVVKDPDCLWCGEHGEFISCEGK